MPRRDAGVAAKISPPSRHNRLFTTPSLGQKTRRRSVGFGAGSTDSRRGHRSDTLIGDGLQPPQRNGATLRHILDEQKQLPSPRSWRNSAMTRAAIAISASRFERMMQQFFRVDPLYAGLFSEVWMWNEWPLKGPSGRCRHRPRRSTKQPANTGPSVQVLSARTPSAKPTLILFTAAEQAALKAFDRQHDRQPGKNALDALNGQSRRELGFISISRGSASKVNGSAWWQNGLALYLGLDTRHQTYSGGRHGRVSLATDEHSKSTLYGTRMKIAQKVSKRSCGVAITGDAIVDACYDVLATTIDHATNTFIP